MDGTAYSGVVEAYDEYEAVEQLRRTYPIVEQLTPIKQRRKVNIDLNEPLWVADRTLSLVAGQFAIMLRAGLPMSRVVELIANQTSDRLMKRILKACAADVSAGYSLARSLEKNGSKIPAVFIETVRAGEESGTLEHSFETLQAYYDRSYKMRSKVRAALTYPIIVVILAIVAITVVMVVLVPQMIDAFATLGTTLPLPTRILIGISNFLGRWWPLLLILAAGLGIALFAYGRTESGKMVYSRVRLHLPVLGKVAKMNTAAQMANTMSALLGSGLPINRVMDIVSRVLDTRCVAADVERCVPELESGVTLAETLEDVDDLPEMLVEMARVGEESGSLESTLHTVGEFYEGEAIRASDRALALLEPLITIILGGFVGFIVIAVYMPMFTMYQGFGM